MSRYGSSQLFCDWEEYVYIVDSYLFLYEIKYLTRCGLNSLEVKLSYIGQIKYHYSERKSTLTQSQLDNIVRKLERVIKAWIERFQENGYKVECENFMTIYWWGIKSERIEMSNLEVKSGDDTYPFNIRIICGDEIYQLLPKRIRQYIEENDELKNWKNDFLGIKQSSKK
jgi:hypothetical protein